MNFKIGDKVKHTKHPLEGVIVHIVYGKIVTYKVAIEVGHFYAKESEIMLIKD